MSGPYSQEQYERAKKAVVSGGVPPDKVPIVQQRITQYEDDRARGYLPAPAAKAPTSESLSHKTPSLDMGNSSVIDYLGTVADKGASEKEDALSKVRAATADDTLQNASKLKVFNDPPEWEPKFDRAKNPFSALPQTKRAPQYFYEPPLEQFQEAVKSGALARQLEREFPGQKGEIDPKWLESSKTYAAYKDAAWRHALAEAMRSNTPIVRAEFSKSLGTMEKLQANFLDPVVAGASGALSGLSMGLADPLIRSVAPETAEAERRSRMRNPTADFAGQVIGGLSPTGLPSLVAKGATKALGAVGLGNKGLSGLAKSTAAGAATGAAEANVRAIAQSAADALDAGESAIETVQRIYDTLAAQQGTLEGGALGGAMGAGGHLVGSLAGKGARTFVSEDGNLKAPLAHGMESGVKMSPIGEPVLPPDVNAQVTRARARRANADDLIAEESIEPMLTQRLREQEAATVRANQETARARERLGEATVDTRGIADEILAAVNEMPAMTPQASAKRTALQRYARRLRSRGQVTAKELDDVISEVDSQANQDAKKPDDDWNRVSAILRKGRDQFQFDEPTKVDNYAIRDAEGASKVVSDYGGMKARQSTEQDLQSFENQQMGLPPKLEPAPLRLGNSSEGIADDIAVLNQEGLINSRYLRNGMRDMSAIREAYAGATQDEARAIALGERPPMGSVTGRPLGPVRVELYPGEKASLGDGRHRMIAAKEAGADRVMARIVKYDDKGNVLSESLQPVSIDGDPSINVSNGSSHLGADELAAMADSAEPKVRLTADRREGFKSKILGTSDPKNAIVSEKLQRLAARAGIPENIPMLQKLRDAQDWKQMLGRAISGVSSGGGTYLRTAQLLRTVPTLKSLSGGLDNPGGLPKMEASPQAEALVDKFLAQAVPEARVANLRGGQAARPGGAYGSRDDEKKLRDDMTDEEAQFALKVIKSILATEGQKLQRAQ